MITPPARTGRPATPLLVNALEFHAPLPPIAFQPPLPRTPSVTTQSALLATPLLDNPTLALLVSSAPLLLLAATSLVPATPTNAEVMLPPDGLAPLLPRAATLLSDFARISPALMPLVAPRPASATLPEQSALPAPSSPMEALPTAPPATGATLHLAYATLRPALPILAAPPSQPTVISPSARLLLPSTLALTRLALLTQDADHSSATLLPDSARLAPLMPAAKPMIPPTTAT